jgi:hypothetical protein
MVVVADVMQVQVPGAVGQLHELAEDPKTSSLPRRQPGLARGRV